MPKPAFTIKPYNAAKAPHLKFVVRSKLSGDWKRKFFEKKSEAQTYVTLRETELANQGREGAVSPSWLRVMAERESERLAAFEKTLTDATDFYRDCVPECQRHSAAVSFSAGSRWKRFLLPIGGTAEPTRRRIHS
jgi:hypothetical protein